MIAIPNLVWPIPETKVEPRNTARVLLTLKSTSTKVLVCACSTSDDGVAWKPSASAGVQILFDLDHCGPMGIEHRIVHPQEVLPVILINHGNRALTVHGSLSCFDVTNMPFKDVTALYAAWLRVQKGTC